MQAHNWPDATPLPIMTGEQKTHVGKVFVDEVHNISSTDGQGCAW